MKKIKKKDLVNGSAKLIKLSWAKNKKFKQSMVCN